MRIIVAFFICTMMCTLGQIGFANLKGRCLNPDTLAISFASDGKFKTEFTSMLLPQQRSCPLTQTSTYLETINFYAEVLRRSPGCLKIVDRTQQLELGQFCFRQKSGNKATLSIESSLRDNVYGLGQYFQTPGSADGDWLGKVWDPKHYPGQSIRPFAKGFVGHTLFPIAYILGKNKQAYGIFVDSLAKQRWDFTDHTWNIDVEEEKFQVLIIRGDELKDLRTTYMKLSGTPPIPPKSTFGLWVSRFGFENWHHLENELADLRSKQFPIDGFALDLQWFGGRFYHPGEDSRDSQMGSLSFNEYNFPNAAQKVSHLKNVEKVDLMTIEESYIAKDLPEFQSLADRNYLATHCNSTRPAIIDANPWWGIGGMLDWTHPLARSYWHHEKRAALAQMGINHHWTDLGEPEMYHPNSCYFGIEQRTKTSHNSIHNAYNLLWAEGIHSGYQQEHPDKRHFILSRSGTSGIQRYGAGLWSGDIAANMQSLAAQFNTQLHMSLSGIDYYGSDIGGFIRNSETLDGDENLLFTQWFANSAMFDFPIRPHSNSIGDYKETSPAKIGDFSSNLANLKLRYHFFPYYYSLAYQAKTEGKAIIAPMVYHFPEQSALRRVGHQKMIGPYLMAGVVANYQETERAVFFPKGLWYNYHSKEFVYGRDQYISGFQTYHDGKFHLPLFVKSGAIIPTKDLTGAEKNIQDDTDPTHLSLLVFPSTHPTSFTYYDDEGKPESEAHIIEFHQRLINNTPHITYKFKAMKSKKIESISFKLITPSPYSEIYINGKIQKSGKLGIVKLGLTS